MSETKNKEKAVPSEISVNRAQIEHRATWMGLIYDEMVKAGVKDAEQIVRRAIRRCGNFHGEGYYNARVDKDDVRSYRDSFLNDVGIKTFDMDSIEADKDKLHISFHYCALCEAWKKQGFDEERIKLLCDMAMDGDRGIAEKNGLSLDLGDTIAKGCPTCELLFHK